MNQMSMFGINPQRDTLAEAIAEVRAKLDDGVTCPCCKQFAKRYRRKIHATMAACMIVMRRNAHPMTSREIGNALRKLKTAYATGDFHKVKKFAVVFNGECKGHAGGFIGIRDALGDRFDYNELMGAKP